MQDDGSDTTLDHDVDRSYGNLAEPERRAKRKTLSGVMQCVLERHSETITYSQGFSFIAVAVLEFASDWLAILFLGRLALGPLRAFLCDGGAEQAEAMTEFFMPILSLANPALHMTLVQKKFEHQWVAGFVMGWGLNIVAPELALRYLDFYVATPTLMPARFGWVNRKMRDNWIE
jgi:hypothetical protein